MLFLNFYLKKYSDKCRCIYIKHYIKLNLSFFSSDRIDSFINLKPRDYSTTTYF